MTTLKDVIARDPVGAKAMQLREEFKALVKKYDDQDVVVRAVTGILASTAMAASNSPGGSCEVVKTIAEEAMEVVKDMHKINSCLNGDHDVFFDADGNFVAADDPCAVTAYFAATGHFEGLGRDDG
jgi:hypothetical protein